MTSPYIETFLSQAANNVGLLITVFIWMVSVANLGANRTIMISYALFFVITLIGSMFLPIFTCLDILVSYYGKNEFILGYIRPCRNFSAFMLVLHFLWWLFACLYGAYDAMLHNRWHQMIFACVLYLLVGFISLAFLTLLYRGILAI